MFTVIYIYSNPLYNYTGTATKSELDTLKTSYFTIQDGNIVTVYMD